jgi:acetone carboxylase gamma subunit
MSVQMSVTTAIGTAYVVAVGVEGERCFHCARCDHEFGPVTDEPKLRAVVAERSIVDASELNRHGAVDDLVLREFYCPGCGAMIAANVQRHGDPVLREIELT